MSLTNIRNSQKEKGFTIVELLIVIVVIAILAAIVLVAYNGITNRARTAKAQAAAQAVQAKANAYNAEIGYFPDTGADLTGATSDKTYALTGVTVSGTAMAAVPPDENTVSMITCPANSTGSAVTGVSIRYWDYAAATPAPVTVTTGSGC